MPTKPHTKWPVAALFGVLGSLAVCLVVLAFLWPTKTAEPKNLPVGISGPAAVVAAFEAHAPDAFDFVGAADRNDAIEQIRTRETYGAIILADAPRLPEVLTAPAGSAVATQMLTGVATGLQAQLAQQITAAGGSASAVVVPVTAVVPLGDGDAAGSGLAAAAFPLVMGGMIGGIVISLLVVGVIRRLVALAGFAVSAGILLTLVLQTWFEYLPGSFALTALVIGVSVLATSAFIVGCTSLLGPRGVGLGAIVTMLVANPLSAAAIPWQFLAAPWGAVGQYMVPGASNALIRSTSYFPDADTARQWWVLVAWTVFGVVLALAGHYRDRATMRVAATTLE
ncbi:hypothetical protein ACFYVR_08275 [Rhodococcus sp. NPDC003318]|uniref:hypothetical protein n=1 Tax=Rhodococcus sp. NPDC003318 TaxID=3364503 RepID=UPI0036B0055E